MRTAMSEPLNGPAHVDTMNWFRVLNLSGSETGLYYFNPVSDPA